ncbi:MAG: hypothetical protein M3Q48_14835, partial [Actinomycetota bacterium]|nr:hypothetical protein [Actinomycetota bacterium]
ADTRRLLARAAREADDLAGAVDTLLELRALEGWEEPDEWELVVVATAAGRWDVVRDTAARLGMEVEPGDGPIDERWHLVVVRYPDGSDAAAVRTGPATARVIDVSLPSEPQRHGDVVVIEPTPLEPFDPEQDDEDIPVFAHVCDLERGGFAGYPVEGDFPGDDAVGALRQALDEAGAALWVYSAGDDEVESGDGTEAGGFYAMVAVVPGAEAAAHDALATAAATASWNGRLAWPELARAADDEAAAEGHERYLEGLR